MRRADRRHQLDRAKARARAKLARWGVTATPAAVGLHAGVRAHCSCPLCGNPRRTRKGADRLTWQERRAMADAE